MFTVKVPIWSIPIERAIPAKRRLCLWTCLLLCFLLCRATVPLNTVVTVYFFFAGPLCFWTRSLPSVSFLQGHCASGHARYSLFLFCRAIVLLDTLVTLCFFFAGPLCFWTRSLLSISFLQGHCASGHGRYDNIMDYL
ncbi:hypothetical protein L210DRAFT_3559447 [Boletus edulis BED1]|uniref:Uncharacterized protein n=1 Tax=Boletus edulis BED1 TaxID=1328754 RepID=A0AAD4BIU6_BOLED|nr:hypothetical protein L210DRAFT_3559447 [Boletus edulis BED1]